MCSVIAQSGGIVADFNLKSCMAIDLMNKGYRWIVIPVGVVIFRALAGIRAVLDLKSGTLVLFRFWEEIPCPKQRVYAIRLHHEDNSISLDIAAADYCEQMKEVLGKTGVEILDMKPTKYGDNGTYMTEITLGFKEGTTPFLFPPLKLTSGLAKTRKISDLSNTNGPQNVTHASQKHTFQKECPWLILEIARKKPNFTNCRFHDPGWEEPIKGLKRVDPNTSAAVLEISPRKLKQRKDQ